jgi:hypothetical protein
LAVFFSLALGLSYAEDGSFLSNLAEMSEKKQDEVVRIRTRQFEQSISDRLLEEYKSPCAGQNAPALADCFPETMKPVRTLADDQVLDRLSVVVSKTEITVDGRPVLQLVREYGRLQVPGSELKGLLISRLGDELERHAEMQKAIGQMLGIEGVGFDGRVLLSLDEELPFEVVRQVMYTAGQAQFGEFIFVGFNRWQEELTSFTSTMPAIGQAMPYEEDPDVPLMLTVVVGESGLDVISNDPELSSVPSAEGPDFPCAFGRPCQGIDDYDWVGFNALMARMKAKYPNDETIIVVPEGGISWDIVARTMDYARCEPFLDMDASKAEWSQWTSQRKDVFPKPVVAGGAQ